MAIHLPFLAAGFAGVTTAAVALKLYLAKHGLYIALSAARAAIKAHIMKREDPSRAAAAAGASTAAVDFLADLLS